MLTPERQNTIDPLDACKSAIRYARQFDFAGYNKHDALNSPLLSRLTFGNRFLRLAMTQAVMRAPINLRSMLGVPRTKNPKGLALFAMSALDLFRVTGDEEWHDLAIELLDCLRKHACHDFPGLSWGYPYSWQDVGFFAPRDFPNRVVTCFVAQAFLSAWDLLGRDEDIHVAEQACDFLLESPKRLFESDDMLCLSYVPDERVTWVVMDVSALVSAVIARTAAATDRAEHLGDARRLMQYVVDKQTDYAAWYYSEPPGDSHITHDNYHTGFILDAILDYSQATGDNRFMSAYDTGLQFYEDRLFEPNGAPKWMDDKSYPYDIHGAAQGILTFSRAAERHPARLETAFRISDWTLAHLYDARGFFYYQQRRFYTKRFNLLRWCNGWMARGLASFAVASHRADIQALDTGQRLNEVRA